MVKIIETNISINPKKNIIKDHQSRIIETESWDEYVDYYKQNLKPNRKHSKFKFFTSLKGDSLPRYGEVKNLKYDSFHLICNHINYMKQLTIRLAYLCE